MEKDVAIIPVEWIERLIFLIRGQRVMLDRDLAALYGVPTKVLNQAVKRNKGRFPEDFMFHMTQPEAKSWWTEVMDVRLRSQNVTLKRGQHMKYRPYAFTEHGILMLSSVLNSERAIQVKIAIMRAFVRLRKILASHVELARKLDALEKKYDAPRTPYLVPRTPFLDPRVSFLFSGLGTLDRQPFASFAPLREYDVSPCSSILGPGVTSNEEPETRNQFLPRSSLFCALV